jgi:diguanylate cyclase (GGDEF)-like protein
VAARAVPEPAVRGVSVRGQPAPAGRWAVWSLPLATRCLITVVTVLAWVWAAQAVWTTPLRGSDVIVFAVLLGAALVAVEATRRVPEPAGMNHNDMRAVWWVPITVLLPPAYVLLAPVPLMALTQWRVRRIPTYKRVYTAAAIGLAHAAGSVLFHALPGRWTDWRQLVDNPLPLTLALAAVAVLTKVLNAVLVGVAVKTADPEARWRGVFIVDHGSLEITEVCAGVLVALIAGLTPLLVVVALPPVLLLQRGLLYAQLRAAARTDAKTGLLHAVAWEREAAAALTEAGRRGQPVAVLLIDIDHFKRVNDTHGHLSGDAVLRGIAGVLHAQVRGGKDLIGRFGGEEFVVLLPGADAAEATRAAERLRRGVAELVTPAEGVLIQVTASIGATVADPAETPDAHIPELLARADLGLYQAKAQGRDRIRLTTRPDRRASH